jgi:O-antigen/teichoic acid export membrane protein
LSGIKKLAGQTLWYGVPTIASRFLGYLMNLSLPLLFAQPAMTADLTQVYAIVPFLTILFTYGLETAFFRFAQEQDRNRLYSTLSLSLFASTVAFTGALYLFRQDITRAAGLQAHPEYIDWMMIILFFDSVTALAFARLRLENRPRRYALARIAGVVLNVGVVLLFLGILPGFLQKHPEHFLARFYSPETGIGYYLIGNIAGSILTFLILIPELSRVRIQFDGSLWRKVLGYSYPLIIVGMGGMVNDMLSRLIYQHVVDLPEEEARHELGIFGNIFRLAVLITILVQAFRMAAEPFFFNRSREADAPRTYARVMKFFVIACCFLYLLIGLYIDAFGWFFEAIEKPAWTEGLQVVPILALGNIFLGIYYNLSIWYKLTNKNMAGALITLGGAAITVTGNILLIPRLHYLGAALATLACYLFMMVASYLLGQRYYPVPYARKKLLAYLVLTLLIYGCHRGLVYLWNDRWFYIMSATGLLVLFALFVARIEQKEWKKLKTR